MHNCLMAREHEDKQLNSKELNALENKENQQEM